MDTAATSQWAVTRLGKPLGTIEVKPRAPKGTEVLLATTYCGVCHSDLILQDGFWDLGGGKRLSMLDRGVKLPLIPGHETVGRVVAVGPDVRGVKVGDQRLIFPWVGCGHCERCTTGEDQLCPNLRSIGVFRDGGYGTHVMVDHPDHLIDFRDVEPALAATFACSGITAYAAAKKLRHIRTTNPVVVIGAGGVGLACIGVLVAFGYQKVIAVDINDARLTTATEIGAFATVNGRLPDVAAAVKEAADSSIYGVIDLVCSPDTAKVGLKVLERGGTYIPVGLFGGSIDLELPTFVGRALTIQSSYAGSRAEMRELIDLACSGKLCALPIERVPHGDPNTALNRIRAGDVMGRLVLDAAMHIG